MRKMSRINVSVPLTMREKINEYCLENGTTITTLVQVSLTHYFNHLEMKEQMDSMLVNMLQEMIEKQQGEKD